MFWRIFKSKFILLKFLIFSSPKFLLCFYFLFLFQFDPPVFILLSFCPISYSQPYFFIGPVSSSAQPCIRPTEPISFGHLRHPDASCHLQPPRPSRHSLLCCPPPAPSSRLASSPSSPLKMAALHRLSFFISISRNWCHWSSTVDASLPLTVRLPTP
jgi:hypothetical protein